MAGARARDKVELGQLLTVLPPRQQGCSAVELIDDVEDSFFQLLWRNLGHQYPPYLQMCLRAEFFAD